MTDLEKKQKFQIGDRVRIADDLGPSMDHFIKGVYATVEYTYAQEYGGNDFGSYSLLIDGFGSRSWYEERQLTKVNEATPPPLREQPSRYHPIGHPYRNLLDEITDEFMRSTNTQ